ncbi:MAG: hypothetical protein M1831_007184 [Alyxoria varia]|nr:MAG: hypothetical protein M1831_007184 [Alyxoria varia]
MSKFNYNAPPAMQLLGRPRQISDSTAAQTIELYLERATGIPTYTVASRPNGTQETSSTVQTKPPMPHLHPECVFTHRGPSLDGRPASGGRVFEQMKRMVAGLRAEKLNADPSLLFGGENDAYLEHGHQAAQDAQVKSYNEQMMEQGDDEIIEHGLEERKLEVQEGDKVSKIQATDFRLQEVNSDTNDEEYEGTNDVVRRVRTEKGGKGRRRRSKKQRVRREERQTAVHDVDDVAKIQASDLKSPEESYGKEKSDTKKLRKSYGKERKLQKKEMKERYFQNKDVGKRGNSVEL